MSQTKHLLTWMPNKVITTEVHRYSPKTATIKWHSLFKCPMKCQQSGCRAKHISIICRYMMKKKLRCSIVNENDGSDKSFLVFISAPSSRGFPFQVDEMLLVTLLRRFLPKCCIRAPRFSCFNGSLSESAWMDGVLLFEKLYSETEMRSVFRAHSTRFFDFTGVRNQFFSRE